MAGVSYPYGTVVSILATPDPGYAFVNWTGNTGGIADISLPSTTVLLDGNKTITANFAVVQHTLAISSTTGGNVTQPGNGTFTFNHGAVVNLVAVPQPLGYAFQKWQGDNGSVGDINAASTNITMNGDFAITAEFQSVPVATLTITSSANGTVLQPGLGTFSYNQGTVVDLLAVPDPGCAFVNWTGNTGGIADISLPSTTVLLDGNKTIAADFVVTHTLAISSTTGGNVTQPGNGTFTFNHGAVVNLVAVAQPLGYSFQKWQGDIGSVGDINAASTNITMDGDFAITAKFQSVPVATLTITSSANGTVLQPGLGTFSYNQGTVVDLLAVPDPGYAFVNWTGTTSGIADINLPSTTLLLDGNKTIVANFTP